MKQIFIVFVAFFWTSQSFFDINSLVNKLNTLPEARQLEAKILVINSQRSFLGTWSDPYYLIWRQEK